MLFASSTNIHGVVDAVHGFHPLWRVTIATFLLGAFVGLLIKASAHFARFDRQPTQTTLSPWYPTRLPGLRYCPSETQLYRKLEEAIIHDKSERDAWNNAADKIMQNAHTKYHFRVMPLFVESLFMFGNVFWQARFGGINKMKDGGAYDSTLGDT